MNIAENLVRSKSPKAKGALDLALTARFGRLLEKLGFSARKGGKTGEQRPAEGHQQEGLRGDRDAPAPEDQHHQERRGQKRQCAPIRGRIVH